jgi:phosphotransferase system enzyme I (PtsI)
VIVDGNRGEVILEPDAGALAHYEARAAHDLARARRLAESYQAPAVTVDGTRVHLAANVELLEEVPAAVELGAESIGLFRTEFLYLERSSLPTEDEHYAHAVAALESLRGRPATFRTLDLGGDKLPMSVRMPAGCNPALGLRSIRYSLSQVSVFKAQLRALYRAAAIAPLRILFPMISGVAELRTVKAICREVCDELRASGVPHDGSVPVGVMIETPSAALTVDLLARECDFLSVGTNDLIQYALAADRQDEHVGYLYHPLHPAILRILRQIVGAARAAGKPVAMCGDMAGDPLFAWVLLGIGLRDLSMAPRQIPLVKSIIRATRLADAEALVEKASALSTETEVEELVTEVMQRHFPIELDVGEGAAASATA